ncbi:uncharacterized protein LOC131190292 [Ahaetulla prasina]|uniref:uncharacterized protein LOC131190292 n=1 Tax=Ahaetulla prasina TaxID=499056 RepID=UPI00264A3F04|nr:uncharacterized protein LOC131190292 [Ahaetulla prasina]
MEAEAKHPDSLAIVLGDLNKANLRKELPKYFQHVNCPTRGKNTLDHCYTTLKDAYRSLPRAAVGHSDHCMIHLVPAYRQRLKATKPIIKSVKTWTEESELKLQACFDCTDWNIFKDTSADLDELTDTVTSYVSFCEDLCVPTRNLRIHSNNKPWFTPKLKQLRHSKEEAYKKGDKMLYNQARNALTREIRAAKRSYSEKLKNQFSANEPANMWKTLKNITDYGKPPSQAEGNQQLADDLNEFYCRFERKLQPPISTTPISDTPTTAKPPTTDPISLGSQPLVIT